MIHFTHYGKKEGETVLKNAVTFLRSRSGAMITIVILCLVLFAGRLLSGFMYVVIDDGRRTVLTDHSRDVMTVLAKNNITLKDGDMLIAPEASDGFVTTVEIYRSYPVSITVDGQTITLQSTGETVLSAVLASNISTKSSDIITPAPGTPTTPNMNINIERVTIDYTPPKKPEPAKPATPNPDSQPKPATTPNQPTEAPPADTSNLPKSVLVFNPGEGSLPTLGDDHQLITPGGTYTVKQVISVSATAYYPWRGYGQKNASGKVARPGTIAVDPKVIPLGSRVFVVAADGSSWIYGYAIAEDTGGVVKGNIIDLLLMSKAECIKFGRRKATVYVLE